MTERSKQLKSAARDKRNNLLAGLAKIRGGHVTRSETLDIKEEEDVFDMVDEDEYQKLVEDRRKNTDFVVDDENLGYYDDGEEHLGAGESKHDAKKRKENDDMLDDLSSDKSKKKSKRSFTSEAGTGQKNTMYNFVKSGQALPAPVSSAPVHDTLNIDDLLSNMKSGSSGGSASRHRLPNSRSRAPGPAVSRAPHHPPRPPVNSHATADYDGQGGMDVAYDDYDSYGSGSGPDHNSFPQAAGVDNISEQDVKNEPDEDRDAPDSKEQGVKDSGPVQQQISLMHTTKKLKKSAAAIAKEKAEAAAAKAQEGAMPLFKSDPSYLMGDMPNALAPPLDEKDRDITSVQVSTSLEREWWCKTGPVEASATEDGGDASSEQQDYVPMFWTDATETNGIIYLFGRVAVVEPGSPKRFLSCCVAVHGSERNLFVLPKLMEGCKADGTPMRAGLDKVYADVNKLLVPHIVPRSKGQGFRCKQVARKYAFEHADVPRESCEYLKVVYSAKHGVPTPAQCDSPPASSSIERIFGATSSALELFMLKRKLMGPSWILIKNPVVMTDSVSWCKLELSIDDPKLVVKMPSRDAPPAPPMTTMSISMKTAVNPTSHVHEVIAISGVVHTRVDIDGDTPMDPSLMKRFTFIRPLGTSCGAGYPPVFPHDLVAEMKAAGPIGVERSANERALLNAFFQKVLNEDPDILASHNLFGFEFDVLLSRAQANKLVSWNRLGRLRRTKVPKGIGEKDVASGRLLCDTYKAAKEFLRETTYSLTHLAASQLKIDRHEIDPMDVPRYFSDSKSVLSIALHTMNDAFIVQKLLLKLQVVPLTKQLTNLSGNLWARTMRGARAERIEYLLLHEFHGLKYILPGKKPFENKKGGGGPSNNEDLHDGEERGVGGSARSRQKAAYAGGLVLEPKKGLYDTFILLLDFNSLYPSIIQEYNLCFTTVEWTKYTDSALDDKMIKAGGGDEDDNDVAVVDNGSGGFKELAPIPDESLPQGVLPRVIKTLVDRRREVKALLKKAKEPALREQLDIRQKALKLTANSMYGCLGFSFSRFFATPIAALVTSKGREALQRTVDLSTNQMGLDVIYGDTDSVMINTNSTDLAQVKVIGNQVKKEVNKLYRSLELDLDGIFKSMLLLKKKKYAAVVINEAADGTITLEKELKGLDLVRRDWCPLSKDAGKFVVDKILSGEPREEIIQAVHEYLHDLAASARAGTTALAEFIVTKGLNKSPKDYPDVKGQPHLQVALKLLKANKPVNIGDHIPYVICNEVEAVTADTPVKDETDKSEADKGKGKGGKVPAADRAHHPDEVLRSNGGLTVDVEWYLTQQILPPISRLCEPIDGTSPAQLSEQLGLDTSKFANASNKDEYDDGWGFTPMCLMDDSERFKSCHKLTFACLSCTRGFEFTSVFPESGVGMSCPGCNSILWGRRTEGDCYSYMSNRVASLVRECVKRYYDCMLVCDDHTCSRRTTQQSVLGYACTENCHGRMVQEYTDADLHTQLKYLESLFDVTRAVAKKPGCDLMLLPTHKEVFDLLKQQMTNIVNGSAYNWVRPSLWSAVFGSKSSQVGSK